MRDDLNASEIIRRFQIRRWLSLFALALAALNALILLFLCDPDCGALVQKHLVLGSLLLASPFFFMGIVVLVYKCPRCQLAPFREIFGGEGIMIMKEWATPERCEHCGVRLK
jgi:ABC-type dipeptide/oligopeptide/nickel transport system permease component